VITPLFVPEPKADLIAKKRKSSLDVAMTLSIAQSITFAANEKEVSEPSDGETTVETLNNVKQLTSR
jgi:hypothetical protein